MVVLATNGLDAGGKYAGNGNYGDAGVDKLTTTFEYALNTGTHLLTLRSAPRSKTIPAA